MNLELDALEMNGTWEIVQLPKGKHVIGSKWIFKTKFKQDGSVDKHKARLVVLGCHQKSSVDYFETFAAVAKLTTVRTILDVASIQRCTLIVWTFLTPSCMTVCLKLCT